MSTGNYELNRATHYPEKRKYNREQCSKPVEFSLNTIEYHQLKNIKTNGTIVDISEEGIGITTNYPLEAGHVLIFKNGNNPIPPSVGTVKWTTIEGHLTKAGVHFII